MSDPAVEEALYDSAAMRSFAGIDLGREPAPDESTVCKFRHLLEKHKLSEALFKAVNRHLHEQGIKVSRGTIVDASIISAPSSTKNKSGERDPEMHQTGKGKQSFFGMKAHIDMNSKEKLIHTVKASAANVSDSLALSHLLHGKETRVYGDQAYRGQAEVIRRRAPRAKDFTNQRYRYNGQVNETERRKNRTKSRIRSRIEHAFWVIKGLFGFAKVRHRGLAKNLHRLQVTCALPTCSWSGAAC